MLPDISPYLPWKRKINPAAMSDGKLAKKLARTTSTVNNSRIYGSIVAYAAFFSVPGVGMTTFVMTGMAAGCLPLFSGLAAGYAVFKLGGKLVRHGLARAVNEQRALETEKQVRDVVKNQLAQEKAEAEIKVIREEARKLREVFDAAVAAGLPLEEAIQVRKSPLVLKTPTRRPGFFSLGI